MTKPNANIIESSELTVPMMHSYAIHCLDTQLEKSAAGIASPVRYNGLERRGAQNSWAPRRRSGRVTLEFDVEVYGQGQNETIFHEQTRTLVVSAHGALLSLGADIKLGQVIILTCKNREAMNCRVVHREETADGETHVGIAFMTYSPNFWGVSFPSEDCQMQAA